MNIGYKLYENLRDTQPEEFERLQLKMALTCEANGWCMEDGYDEDGKRYLIINPPVEPSLEELKTAKFKEVNEWTERKIISGFVSTCSGESVIYDSDLDTQITMQGIALNVNTERFTTNYPHGCPVRGYLEGETEKTVQYLNAEGVLKFCADLSEHIGKCKLDGWTMQNAVLEATTKEELDTIIFD